MSIFAKSIQLLLCFVFSLWSITGPRMQIPCGEAADALAPQFKKKTVDEMEQAAHVLQTKKTPPAAPAPVLDDAAVFAEAQRLAREKQWRALFTDGAIPRLELGKALAYLDWVTARTAAVRFRLPALRDELPESPDIRAFCMKMKEPFRSFFLQECASFDAYKKDGKFPGGAPAFLQASKLYTFVSALEQADFAQRVDELLAQYRTFIEQQTPAALDEYLRTTPHPARFAQKIIRKYPGEHVNILREVTRRILTEKEHMPADVLPYYLKALDVASKGGYWFVRDIFQLEQKLEAMRKTAGGTIPAMMMGQYLPGTERGDLLRAAGELNAILLSGRTVTEADILAMHRTAAEHIAGTESADKGAYRILEITMEGMGPYGSSPERIPAHMEEVLKLMNGQPCMHNGYAPGKLHPVELAAQVMHEFIAVHPFMNGNKRLGILLANYVLAKHGYPPFVLTPESVEEYGTVFRFAVDYRELAVFMAEMMEKEQPVFTPPVRETRKTDEEMRGAEAVGSSL
jgi:hypothetical protein